MLPICLIRIDSCLAQFCKHEGGCYLDQQQNEVINVSFSPLVKKTLKNHLLRTEKEIETVKEEILSEQPEAKNTQLVYFGYPYLPTEKIQNGFYQETSRTVCYLGCFGREILIETIEAVFYTKFIKSWSEYISNYQETFNIPEKSKFIKSFLESNGIYITGKQFETKRRQLLRILERAELYTINNIEQKKRSLVCKNKGSSKEVPTKWRNF